jgi:peptidyl-prolyl cis-trans isomerase SurA
MPPLPSDVIRRAVGRRAMGWCLRCAAVALPLVLPTVLQAAPPVRPGTTPPVSTSGPSGSVRIVAVVNGDVISNVDVDDRAKLFALSTGQPLTQDVLAHLRPQIERQLIDEKLRLQEAQRRHIIIPDKQIAAAIQSIESRNGMSAGALRQKLAADGISLRTLIDQIRTQLAWMQVVRDQLGAQSDVAPNVIADRQRALNEQTGKPEYQVAEIFIPVEDPANTADAQRFAETVITQLRAGTPFPIMAAQFSQSQDALQGGERGWVQPNQMDPAVAHIVAEMPIGAVSNPIKVPGGLDIVTLQAKREIGNDMGTVLTLREVFLPFATPLNPQAPTQQQQQTLIKARGISASVHSCEQMDAVAKANPVPGRPADPGEVRLESANPPPFRQMLATMPLGPASQPLIANDGIMVLSVCTREQKNMATENAPQLREQIIEERAELTSRQLQQTLRRQATIDVRSSAS